MRRIPRHIAAVLSAMRFRDPSPEAMLSLDQAEWNELLSYCDLMHLTLPLGAKWGDVLPHWVRARIERNRSDNAQRFEQIKAAYREVAQALDVAGVEHLILKGFSLWPGYTDDLRLRLQSDIDLYCPPESLLRARDVLVALGYELSTFGPSHHLPNLVRKSDWKWRGNFYDPEMPPCVELHHTFWDYDGARLGPSCLNEFWRRRMIRQVEDLTFRALHAADNLAYSTLEILRDLFAFTLSTHKVYELAHFLHVMADDVGFWEQWLHLHHHRTRSCEAIAFRLATEWFDCHLAPQAETEVQTLPCAVEKWIQNWASSALDPVNAPNKDALWLHLALLRSFRNRRTVLWRAIQPAVMPSMAAAEQRFTTPQGQPRQPWLSQRHLRFVLYFFSRVNYRLRIFPSMLWHGLCYAWSLGLSARPRRLGDGAGPTFQTE